MLAVVLDQLTVGEDDRRPWRFVFGNWLTTMARPCPIVEAVTLTDPWGNVAVNLYPLYAAYGYMMQQNSIPGHFGPSQSLENVVVKLSKASCPQSLLK